MLRKILLSAEALSDINFERLKNNLINSDNNMYMNVDSLIDIKDIISNSINITLMKVNVESHGCNQMYMDKYLKEYKINEIIDQFIERKINYRDFYLTLLGNFYDRNGKTCKILFYLQLRFFY